MTPKNKIKFKDSRQIRSTSLFLTDAQTKRFDSAYYVEGYAMRYAPYTLYTDDDGEAVNERFDRGCFDSCDMGDIIFLVNHEGRVYARQTNDSLFVSPDDNGLFMAADLSRTEGAKEVYSDIAAGMLCKMSWAFDLGEYEYDARERMIIHHSVKKIWDVSAVTFPANRDTEISARSLVDGLIDTAARIDAELDARRKKLRLKIEIENLKGKSK